MSLCNTSFPSCRESDSGGIFLQVLLGTQTIRRATLQPSIFASRRCFTAASELTGE